MGRAYHRPLYAVDYGDVDTVGSGVVLGDNSDSTGKRYFEDSGSVLVYPSFSSSVVPGGREIIAVRAGHRQRNNGALGLYNGWPATFLRISNTRQGNIKAYKQDGYIDAGREVLSPPLYNKDLAPWTAALITLMSTDTGAATGEIGPSGNRWCMATESFIQVIWDDNVPVPTISYPADGATISTSSVDFEAVHPAPQEEQPVRTVFQVSRVSTFDDTTVKTFVGGLNKDTTAGSKSKYDSKIASRYAPEEGEEDTFTDLGPGLWYVRVKGRDMRGADHESAWGATTSFSIVHAALPVPSLTAPQNGTTSPTPFGIRRAQFTTQPSGERLVGVAWRFSKDPAFGSGVVGWENRKTGIIFASADVPGIVQYDATPVATVAAGQYGPTVSIEDPYQYLSQGLWYAQVRAVDAYGQYGAWSSNFSFTVAHVPVVQNPLPRNGKAFDQYEAPVTWDFTDPWDGDQQSAFQMRVLTAADLVLQDTGKVSSPNPRANMVIPNTYQQANLKVSLDVWDRDDVKSAAPTVSLFRLSLAPVITLPFPAPGEQIISGQPSISWSCTFSTGGVTQKSYRVRYLDAATGNSVFDSGTITSAATTYAPPRAILRNLRAYTLELTVTDTDDLPKKLLRNFSTNFELPAYVPSFADSSGYRANGYVNVYWPQGQPDPYFFEWRIYRREVGTDEWIYAGAVTDSSITEFRDWLVSGYGEFEYSVTQAATRFGSIVESEFNDFPDPVSIESDNYWLIVPSDETLNLRVPIVTGDKATNRLDVNQYAIMGRGLKQNTGGRIGWEGNLTVSVRHSAGMSTARFVKRLVDLSVANVKIMLRDPFGEVYQIAIGEVSRDKLAGVGHSPFADVDLPFREVTD